MGNKVKSYDPSLVNFIYAGLSIEEFMPGTFINIRRDNPAFKDMKGCDGEVTRFQTKDKRGSIIFTLLQTSRSNLALSGFAIGDELIGQGGLPTLVRDKNSSDIMASAEAWLLSTPEVVYSKGIEGRRWTLRCNGLYILLAGEGND